MLLLKFVKLCQIYDQVIVIIIHAVAEICQVMPDLCPGKSNVQRFLDAIASLGVGVSLSYECSKF